MAGVAVNEVTEAADVGFGSFYNHFPSKEAIYAALIDDVFDDFGNALDRIADHVTDPAEVLAASVRYTITRAIAEPVWGRFLVQTGLSPRGLSGGLGRRMARDIGIGVASGRFKAEDQLLVSIAVGSTVLGAITLALELPNKKSRNTVAERTADVLLRILGLTPKQASTIARRPLPKLNGSKV